MKKIQLSVLALLASSSLLTAGGDISAFTPPVEEEVNLPVQAPVVNAPVVKVTEEQEAVQAPVVVSKEKKEADVSPYYVGLGLVAVRYDSHCFSSTEGCDGTMNVGGLLLRGGYDFNPYVGVEARGIFTVKKDNGGKIQHYGAFVKPMYPFNDEFNLYGLLGVAKTKTSGNLRVTDTSGLAYGIGLEYDLSDDKKDDKKKELKYKREFDGLADQEKGLGLFVEYEKLYYKSGAPKLDAISAGLTYDF